MLMRSNTDAEKRYEIASYPNQSVYHENVYSLNTIKSTFVLCAPSSIATCCPRKSRWRVARAANGKIELRTQ